MKIRIVQQHTHAGITYPAGSEIDLPEDAARWLLAAGAELREKEVAQALQSAKVIDDLRETIKGRA